MSLVSKAVQGATDINDELLFIESMASAKGAAKAYLTATLACTTPELRTLFSSHLNQVMLTHSSLVELALKKGWLDPTDTPKDSLIKISEKINTLFNHDE